MQDVPVLILGAGGVGRALLEQIVAARDWTARRNGIRFRIAGLSDSRAALWRPEGLADADLAAAVEAKRAGRPLGGEALAAADLLARMAAEGLERALVVDVTAADGMEPLIERALDLGYGVALANKKPLAGPWAQARRFYHHPRLRHESTVGGGQPVIATLRYLLDTNDPIHRIEGQLSGTLGYICGRLDEGAPFSEAVAEARRMGYTEPDPREDLGGGDVRRKIMILGRMAGWPLEEADVAVEALYPAAMASLDVEAFMDAAAATDEAIAARVAAARAAGQVLRFTAEVTAGGGRVGLAPIAADSPLARLKYIAFETDLYRDQPLMIGGKGAGVEMTAAGVLGDMIALVREGAQK